MASSDKETTFDIKILFSDTEKKVFSDLIASQREAAKTLEVISASISEQLSAARSLLDDIRYMKGRPNQNSVAPSSLGMYFSQAQAAPTPGGMPGAMMPGLQSYINRNYGGWTNRAIFEMMGGASGLGHDLWVPPSSPRKAGEPAPAPAGFGPMVRNLFTPPAGPGRYQKGKNLLTDEAYKEVTTIPPYGHIPIVNVGDFAAHAMSASGYDTQWYGANNIRRATSALRGGEYFMKAARTVAGTFRRAGGIDDKLYSSELYGAGLGYEQTANPLGESTRRRLSDWWEARNATGFGFNPYYTSEEAQATREVMRRKGYGSKWEDRAGQDAINMMHDLMSKEKGLDLEVTADLYDKMHRYLGMSGNEFKQRMFQVDNLAQASGMNSKEYQAAAGAAATSLVGSRGITADVAWDQVVALAAGTGMTPDFAGKIMSNPNNTIWGMAATNQSSLDYFRSQNYAQTDLAGSIAQVEAALGAPIEQISKDPTLLARFRELSKFAPEALGGLDETQMRKIGAVGKDKALENIGVQDNLLSVIQSRPGYDSKGEYDRLVTMDDGSELSVHDNYAKIAEYLQSGLDTSVMDDKKRSELQKKVDAIKSGHWKEGPGDVASEINKYLSDTLGQENMETSKEVWIKLDPSAEKYFDIVSDGDADSGSNSKIAAGKNIAKRAVIAGGMALNPATAAWGVPQLRDVFGI